MHGQRRDHDRQLDRRGRLKPCTACWPRMQPAMQRQSSHLRIALVGSGGWTRSWMLCGRLLIKACR